MIQGRKPKPILCSRDGLTDEQAKRLTIGTLIAIADTAHPSYTEDGERLLVVQPHTIHRAYVTGYRNVQVGTYVNGAEYGGTLDSEPDYDPPYLRVKHTVLVLLYRRNARSRECMALPQHVRLLAKA